MNHTRLGILLCGVASIVACGTTPEPAPTPAAVGVAAGAALPGWQLRDVMPYPRLGATSVFDADGDRMILFGGIANDTWALPFSGPHQGQWQQIALEGPHPPTHWRGGGNTESAVYDPAGKRMILLEDSSNVFYEQALGLQLWQLSLTGEPTWSVLETTGPAPSAGEVHYARMVHDAKANRVLVFGGEEAAVWSLTLGATPTWARLAGAPTGAAGAVPAYYLDHSMVLDSVGDQLVVFGGYPHPEQVWGFSLSTLTWAQINAESPLFEGVRITTVFDPAARRILIVGDGTSPARDSSFWLSTGKWTQEDVSLPPGSAGVLDPSRRRMVFFGGLVINQPRRTDDLLPVSNATVAFSLDGLGISAVSPATQPGVDPFGFPQMVFDPKRGAVVAFGSGYPTTKVHGLGAGDAWTPLEVGVTPGGTSLAPIYDPDGKALFVFGGAGVGNDLWRLSSTQGATWESLAGDGPPHRVGHVAVHDDAHHRMIVFGGTTGAIGSTAPLLADVWGVSLDGQASWEELTPATEGPGGRVGTVGVYDPVGDRVVLLGGYRSVAAGLEWINDAWTLSLGSAPATWAPLLARGVTFDRSDQLSGFGSVSAVYDPAGHRMIVLDQGLTGSHLYALELGEMPFMHRFCEGAGSLALTGSEAPTSGAVVLTPDGLFLAANGGAFRFDLATPYCD